MWRRLRYWWHRAEREKLLHEEIDAHVAMLADAFEKQGMSRKDAEQAARRQFGSQMKFEEESRSMWIAHWANDLIQDANYGLRSMARQPGLAIAAIASSGLGIAACALIFGITNHALLRLLPVQEPERVMALYGRNVFRGKTGQSLSYPDVEDLRAAKSLKGIAVFSLTPGTIATNGDPQRYWGLLVSANYFDIARPGFALGQGFDKDKDDRPGAAPLVVLSHSLWQSRFNGDPQIVGKPIDLNGRKMTVSGVTRAGFRGTELLFSIDYWVPFSAAEALAGIKPGRLRDRSGQWLMATARLQDGVSLAQAAAEVDGIGQRLQNMYPATNRNRRFLLEPAGQVNPAIRTMLGVFFLVLLIVAALVHLTSCANVANLLLARASARQREIATRLAIGASRGRLIRQLLTESTMLALCGGIAGYFLAQWGVTAIGLAQIPLAMPLDLTLSLDHRAMAFAAFLSVLTGIAFGMAPALRASKASLVGGLKDEAIILGSSTRLSLRNALVVGQVAVCMVLLVLSGLSLRSLNQAYHIDLGFQHRNLLLASFDPSLHGYTPDTARRLADRLFEDVRALPGVEMAALANSLPLNMEGTQNAYEPVAETSTSGQSQFTADIYAVSPEYFETIGVRRIDGVNFPRGVPDEDVAIVNQTLAEKAFGAQNPVGRRIRYLGRIVRIIGLVAATKSRTIGEEPHSCLYFPIAREMRGNDSLTGMTLILRTNGDPLRYVLPLRETIRKNDPNLAVFHVRTMEQQLDRALTMARIAAWLFGLAGAIGLVVATAGLAGVIGFSVARRTKEIGIRLAIGARPSTVLRSILQEGMVLTLLGAAIGLALAIALARMAGTFLYGISPIDAWTFALAPALLLTIAMVACFLPARRASRLDPLRALRHD
ncbi:MAG: ABC transporter permease [Acidobacteria bacterium]|nr:ABC transporter permease [Acidobacteriota bacterium]